DLLSKLDQSMTSNPQLRKLITQAKAERDARLKKLPDEPPEDNEPPAENPVKDDTKPVALLSNTPEPDRHDAHHDPHQVLHQVLHHDPHQVLHHARREEKRREENYCRVAPDGVSDLEFERESDPVEGEIEIQRSR